MVAGRQRGSAGDRCRRGLSLAEIAFVDHSQRVWPDDFPAVAFAELLAFIVVHRSRSPCNPKAISGHGGIEAMPGIGRRRVTEPSACAISIRRQTLEPTRSFMYILEASCTRG